MPQDNSCFADIEKGLHNSVYHKGAGFRFYGMDTFMRHKYETVSRKPEEYYDMDVVNEDEAPGATVIPSFDYSSPDVFNGTQAEVMRQDNDTVIPMRPGLSPQSYSVSQDGHESHADAGEQVRDVSAKETAGDEVIPVVEPVAKESVGEQPVPKEAAPAVGKKKDEALLSWGGLLDGIGLGGLSSVGKNLGHVISMLPDLVISMFNGKSKNLKLSNNLLPLTLLIMALFFTKKNPFLKLLLLGFAGINLLDKACRETNDIESNRASKVSYRRYQDQALDSRITGVRLSGGVLVMDIDGRPFAQSLDPRVLEAHERGLLPLNVICNELLAKYDAKMESVAESYERQVARGEEEGRPLALK